MEGVVGLGGDGREGIGRAEVGWVDGGGRLDISAMVLS